MARTEEEEEYFQSFDENLFGAEAFKSFEENCVVTTNLITATEEEHSSTLSRRSNRLSRLSRLSSQSSETQGSVTRSSIPPPCSSVKQPERTKRPSNNNLENCPPATRRRLNGAPINKQSSLSSISSFEAGLDLSTSTKDDQGPKQLIENGVSGLITEEMLLIKSNRLMSADEIPPRWLGEDSSDNQKNASQILSRASRRRSVVGGKIDTDVLSEAAFTRALYRLETGEVDNFEEAIALEKTRIGNRRSRSRKNVRGDDHEDSDGIEEELINANQEEKSTESRKRKKCVEETEEMNNILNSEMDGGASGRQTIKKRRQSDRNDQLSSESRRESVVAVVVSDVAESFNDNTEGSLGASNNVKPAKIASAKRRKPERDHQRQPEQPTTSKDSVMMTQPENAGSTDNSISEANVKGGTIESSSKRSASKSKRRRRPMTPVSSDDIHSQVNEFNSH